MDHDKINYELIENLLEWIVYGNHEVILIDLSIIYFQIVFDAMGIVIFIS